jgi:hypothetical protein
VSKNVSYRMDDPSLDRRASTSTRDDAARSDRAQLVAELRRLAPGESVADDDTERGLALRVLALCGTDPAQPYRSDDATPIASRIDAYVVSRALAAAEHTQRAAVFRYDSADGGYDRSVLDGAEGK